MTRSPGKLLHRGAQNKITKCCFGDLPFISKHLNEQLCRWQLLIGKLHATIKSEKSFFHDFFMFLTPNLSSRG